MLKVKESDLPRDLIEPDWRHSEVLRANGILTFREFADTFWPGVVMRIYTHEVHTAYQIYLGIATFELMKNGGPKKPAAQTQADTPTGSRAVSTAESRASGVHDGIYPPGGAIPCRSVSKKQKKLNGHQSSQPRPVLRRKPNRAARMAATIASTRFTKPSRHGGSGSSKSTT